MIKKDNDKILTVVPNSLKHDLQILADTDERSLSKYVAIILKNHVDDIKKRGKFPNVANVDGVLDHK